MMVNDPVMEMLRGSCFEERKMGTKTWVVVCTLPNGYEITESAACVDPQDFDEEVADSICRSKIRDRIKELLAYEACSRGGAEKTEISRERAPVEDGARLLLEGACWGTAMVAAMTNRRARVRIKGWAPGVCVKGGVASERGKLLMVSGDGDEHHWLPVDGEMRSSAWEIWEVMGR